jgi:hypothetical protein
MAMSALAEVILEAATAALAGRDGGKPTGREYREDARAVAVAVLAAVGGAKRKRGMLPFQNGISQQILALADELEGEGIDPR